MCMIKSKGSYEWRYTLSRNPVLNKIHLLPNSTVPSIKAEFFLKKKPPLCINEYDIK